MKIENKIEELLDAYGVDYETWESNIIDLPDVVFKHWMWKDKYHISIAFKKGKAMSYILSDDLAFKDYYAGIEQNEFISALKSHLEAYYKKIN